MSAAKTLPVLTTALLLLAACATDPLRTPAPIATSVAMHCGQQPVVLKFSGDELLVQMGENRWQMEAAISASGARYQAADDETSWLWTKGNTATLVLDGQSWPQCLEPGALEKPFEARGNEPFWHLAADNGILTLTRPGAIEPQPQTYQTGTEEGDVVLNTEDNSLTVRITDAVCRDTMSGMPYPRTVSLEKGSERLEGCGGSPQQLLQGSDWQVVDLDGDTIAPSPDLTLRFDTEGRVSGRAACNRYMGDYSLTGEGLTIKQVATTKMACDAATMAREQRFLALLAEIDRFDVDDNGELRLIAADKTVIQARLPWAADSDSI